MTKYTAYGLKLSGCIFFIIGNPIAAAIHTTAIIGIYLISIIYAPFLLTFVQSY